MAHPVGGGGAVVRDGSFGVAMGVSANAGRWWWKEDTHAFPWPSESHRNLHRLDRHLDRRLEALLHLYRHPCRSPCAGRMTYLLCAAHGE